MIKLLIYKQVYETLTDSSFGGLPVRGDNENFGWPTCRNCDGPMQFLGKIVVDNKIEQIFMCQNDPGVCEDWDANDGGNKVLVTTSKELVFVQSPAEGVTTRETNYGVEIVNFKSKDYNEARLAWAENNNKSPREVLGQLFGAPSWIQGDETPVCDSCKKPMRFVVQLEQGPDWKTEMNFGGGCAYLFDCTCDLSAKFLWQC